ncbi:hypothetical protein FRC10_012144 [Ceratobasidium sp. 414]|nr:hypothetical protein FRC10_012144 [Ceratobasidium sp. 414]
MSVFAAKHSPSLNTFTARVPQGIDLTRARSEPIPLRPSSSLEERKLEAWVQQIETFASKPDVFTTKLESITLEDADKLQQKFQARGIKFRFDWDAGSTTAYLRMPKSLHSTTIGVWVNKILPEVESQLRKIALCGQPTLWYTGDSRCALLDGSTREPDTGFLVYDGRASVRPDAIPRVIFEFALTQLLEDVLFKAWNYLFASKEPYAVHAVVVCNVENPVRQRSTKPCRLTVDVWVRKATGDMAERHTDIDFPMDDCEPDSQADKGAPTQEVPSPPQAATRKAKSGLGVQAQPRETQADASGRVRTVLGQQGQMWRRNKKEIEVYNESLGDEQKQLEPLKMDAYDFLRVCQTRPDSLIEDENRHVSIDLEPLQTVFGVLVRGERDEQRRPGGGQMKKDARPAEGEDGAEPVRKRARAVLRSYETIE